MCCNDQDIIMIDGLQQDDNGNYFEKSYCNNCNAEFLDVWEHTSHTMTKQGHSHKMDTGLQHHKDCQCVRCKPLERPCNCDHCQEYKNK